MTFESVDHGDEDEAQQPIKPARCRCYMPTTATPPPVITAADQVRRNLRMSAKWATFGRLMVEQLLSEHDAAVERADAAERELAVLPERWRELLAERDAARRELAELGDEWSYETQTRTGWYRCSTTMTEEYARKGAADSDRNRLVHRKASEWKAVDGA